MLFYPALLEVGLAKGDFCVGNDAPYSLASQLKRLKRKN